MRVSSAIVAAALGSTVQATIHGFNSGASDDKGNPKSQQDFEKEFKTAKNLQGAPGDFNTIRLYSNIQWNTPDTPIAAIPAAVATNTSLLLGIWASGTDNIDNELKALTSALDKYGSKLADLVVGISVGSEDLYRDSNAGRVAKAGVGNDPDTIVRFIKEAKKKLANTALKGKPFTHVDTWTAWVNGTNAKVINEIDFLAVNAFPFYEAEHDNQISNAYNLLNDAIEATEGVAGGKDVWVTETGWAYSGPSFGAGKATVDNAGEYWQDVGCKLFGKKNVFWYTLRDANPANEVKFAITDNLSTTPRFNLTCPAVKDKPASSKPSGNNSTSSDNATDGSDKTGSGSSGSSGSNSASGSASGSGSAANPSSTGPAQTESGSGLTSVSMVNSMAMALSVVFALAAWTL
jgi:glucan endo-1,3-beta-D-glucosidase